jgi:hypothetical protein
MTAMRRNAVVFWASAALAAAAFSLLVPVLMPYGALRLVADADRERAWLLTVFCFGVLAVLFGLTGLLGAGKLLGIRDVLDAGSIGAAKAKAAASRAGRDADATLRRYDRNFGVWLVATGGFLLAIYFGLWLTI